jgi:hypothetical protein
MANPSLLNSTKATKACGGIREEEQRKSTKNSKVLQDLGGSSHKERDLVGEDVDVDLLYLFFSNGCKIH